MNSADRRALVALPIVLLLAAFIAWAGSQGGYTFAGIPVFALGIAVALILQWIAFIPAYILKTEKFYDLMGSITYLSVGPILHRYRIYPRQRREFVPPLMSILSRWARGSSSASRYSCL